MKKLFSFLAILMMAMNAWAQAYLLQGEGTSANPYKISQAGELVLFIDKVNNNGQTDVYCELTADIDMTDYCSKFAPIGTWDKPYTGTFNGNGHRIKNLNYTGVAGKEVGLFGVVAGENTTIKGLIIDKSCSFTTNSAQQAYGAAGIVACLKLHGEQIHFTLSGCGNEATINGDLMVAGLVGGLLNAEESTADKCSITIENCYNTGNIKGHDGETQTAALIGYGLHTLTVRNCYNTGAVTNCPENHSLIRYKEGTTLTASTIYNLSTVAVDANATSTTAEALADGSVCYLLNGSTSTGTLAWYQNINNGKTADPRPVVESTHGTVYYTGTDYCPDNIYSNAATPHSPDTEDGITTCSVCHKFMGYQEPGQDASGNYLLGNKGNLLWLAGKVNAGSTSINAKLTADIDLGDNQTMIGTSNKNYAGTFDGDGHTVTVHYVATEDFTALFNYVYGATIKNLRTAGSITTGYQCAAGIVAYCGYNGKTHITNCISSVTITSTFSEEKDGQHGGIVAWNDWDVYLNNVVFNGKLLGEKATCCGGMVGCTTHEVHISSCLFCPSEVTFSASGAMTLARVNAGLYVSNSYYTATLGTAQGNPTTAKAIGSGEVCYKLNGGETGGSQAWYQNLDNGQTVDAMPVLFKTHGTVYGGPTQCPSNTYSNTQKTHTEAASYDDGEMYCADCHKFLHHQQPSQDADNTYLIANKGNLCWFANKVNSGQFSINGKLTADVSLGSNTDMIGTGYWYEGTFDGDGHTVTVNYTTTSDYTALFRYVKNATIKNLRTAGSINTTGEYAAGIVARCLGYNTQITNCASSVAIKSTSVFNNYGYGNNGYWGRLGYFGLYGGIVAHSPGSVTLNNVLFDGKIDCTKSASWGGLIGYSSDNATITITNCLFNPSYIPSNCDDPNTLARYESETTLTITNSYCAESQSLKDGQGTKVTAEQLCLGDVCNKLNAGNSSTVWTQNLEKNAYPTLGTSGLHYARTMSNDWGTVVLPFDVTYSQSNGNYKLYKLSAASVNGSEGTLTFAEYENGTIPAGTPMAVKKLSGEGIDIAPASTPNYSTSITEQTNSNASLPAGWTMKGTYSNLTNQKNIYYIASNQFWYAENAITIAPFRAWFAGPASNDVKAFNILVDEDGDATSIHNAECTMQNETGAMFNLAGQRVNSTAKGILIKNRKKIYIK